MLVVLAGYCYCRTCITRTRKTQWTLNLLSHKGHVCIPWLMNDRCKAHFYDFYCPMFFFFWNATVFFQTNGIIHCTAKTLYYSGFTKQGNSSSAATRSAVPRSAGSFPEQRLLTTPMASPTGGSYNPGQKSWDKFALLAHLGTRQTRLQVHLPNLAPHPPPPPPPIQCWKLLPAIPYDFQHCVAGGGGGGGGNVFLKGKHRFFQTSVVKHR